MMIDPFCRDKIQKTDTKTMKKQDEMQDPDCPGRHVNPGSRSKSGKCQTINPPDTTS